MIKPSSGAHPPEGLYIARTLVRVRREVPVSVLNATRRDQNITKGSPLAHYEPVTLVTPHDVEQSQVRDIAPKLQDVIAAVKLNLGDAES
jgi:hypothetical protein